MINELGNVNEQFLDVVARFGRGFCKVQQILLLFESQTFLKGYLSQLFLVGLISNQDGENFRGARGPHLMDPILQVLKSVTSCDRIADDSRMSPTVEDLGDRAERLLACCIPNLQFEHLVFNSDKEASKFNTDCHIMLFFEIILN
jgi:hypothetical protein